ncbi:hypothetical protein GCM10027347_17310 [Larkinella harenae]
MTVPTPCLSSINRWAICSISATYLAILTPFGEINCKSNLTNRSLFISQLERNNTSKLATIGNDFLMIDTDNEFEM